MSFNLTGDLSAGGEAEQKPQMVKALRIIKATITAPVAAPTDGDGCAMQALSENEISALRCEGRAAAFEGLPLRSCPYNMASRAKREAWLEGYHTRK